MEKHKEKIQIIVDTNILISFAQGNSKNILRNTLFQCFDNSSAQIFIYLCNLI